MNLIEENIVKKIDRAIHRNDYRQMKDDLQAQRAQARLLAQEIEELEKTYNSIKNSPQAPALAMELEGKKRNLQATKDKLMVYKDLGRNGLGVDPEEYKLDKAKEQGVIQGGLGGLTVGGLGGLALGNQIFSESTDLEEASKTLNPAYSKPLSRGLQKVGNVLPNNFGGNFANRLSTQINQNRSELGNAIRQDRQKARQADNPADAALHRADAIAKSAVTDPNAIRDDHPTFQKIRKGNAFQPAKSPEEIDKLIAAKGMPGQTVPRTTPIGTHGPNDNSPFQKGQGYGNPILSSDQGSKVSTWTRRHANNVDDFLKHTAGPKANDFINNTAIPKTKDFINNTAIPKVNDLRNQYNNLDSNTKEKLKLGGSLLGAGALTTAAMSLFGDGDVEEIPEIPEVPAITPGPTSSFTDMIPPNVMEKINQVPGGINTVVGVPAALATGYGVKKIADRYRR